MSLCFLPLPPGERVGVRGRERHPPALTPALSRKREREQYRRQESVSDV